MWSKRRKKFARTYDPDKHRLYLFELWFTQEVSRRLCEELDKAILFGVDRCEKQEDGPFYLSIADEIIKKCF